MGTLGIHVSDGSICDIRPGLWVIFCRVCPGYESALPRFALVIGKCKQFIAIVEIL